MITLRDFSIPDEPEVVKAIDINNFESLASLNRVEDCLMACSNVNHISISLSAYSFSKEELAKIGLSARAISKEELGNQVGQVIEKIATYSKNLVSLHLRGRLLCDDDLKPISQEHLPELREVSISRNIDIGSVGVKFIATQCPELTSLDLHYSVYRETNQAAFYIGQFLGNLKQLNMHRSCNLSDLGLSAIAEGCPQLEMIYVGRNYELTDKSLKAISENCPKLVTLGMYYNRMITEKGLQYIVQGCPNFKNFYDGGGWGAIPALKAVKAKYPQINFM